MVECHTCAPLTNPYRLQLFQPISELSPTTQGRRELLQKVEESKRKEKSQSPAASEEPLFEDDEDAGEDLFTGIPKTTAASTPYVGTSEHCPYRPALICFCL